jgi:hypothetical protein
MELDELVEKWTLLDDEQSLVAGKRGATRLGFVLLLKFYLQHGHFPRGRSALPDDAVQFVADQVKVPASELGLYEWSGRTSRYHQAQIREHLGFRECSVEDADKLASWLSVEVCEDERQRDRVRELLLIRCRDQRIEPPSVGRVDRFPSTLPTGGRSRPSPTAREPRKKFATTPTAMTTPPWVTVGTTSTRYADLIGGDLSLTVDQTGAADLALANNHGDIVTTVDLPSANAAATSITGWNSYDE